ncbi:hypothetical protein DFH28DRAFT_929401 [Melampsora americana]|nr:hypothetical protein DFH28DRAFT_938423 [Melampsora americana]KAH9813836.1 hypothetical protein DFH28DRAFT_929401 [Melampsora americana]
MSLSNHIFPTAVFKPDIYALSSFIKDQFEKPTRGDAIIVYSDGQTRYVHRYDCVTYHIVDPNTPDARCVITCLVFLDENPGHKHKCELSYLRPDFEGKMTIPCFSDVVIADQMDFQLLADFALLFTLVVVHLWLFQYAF